MSKTIKSKIQARIKRAPKGKIFVLSDFSDLGTYENIKKTFNNLVQEKILIQIKRGIYMKPNYSEVLRSEVPASPTAVASAYARKNNWKIAYSGVLALNNLGLSTQVPNTYQYISSGPTRNIQLNNGRIITFRHVEPRESDMDSLSSLVIEALKALGKENITNSDLATIKERLSKEQYEQLKKDAFRARAWVKDAIFKMEEIDE